MQRCPLAHSGQGFAVLAGGLAAPGITDARLRHQVPLIGAVCEDRGRIGGAVLHGDLRHARPLSANSVPFTQPVPLEDGHAGFAQQVAEDPLRTCGSWYHPIS